LYQGKAMTLYIKNMVCDRCILAVKNIMKEMDIPCSSIRLGELTLAGDISVEKLNLLSDKLNAIGFELINDKKSRIIEKIKTTVIELVQSSEAQLKINLSDYLANRLNYDYKYLSTLFSEVEGITIEKYFISQKIEKVKELLVYDELSLSEISDSLGYSSVSYLSNQFKKVTGLTPSHFKNIRTEKRKPLDKV
jgi:AraC-like DNA-binding protein